MANLGTEQVLSVRHWNDTLFSFTTTRSRELRFENGHFVMVGLPVDGKPLTRAYHLLAEQATGTPGMTTPHTSTAA